MSPRVRQIMLISLVCAAVFTAAWQLWPQSPVPSEAAQVRAISSRLTCQQCAGLSVWDSNAEPSFRMRSEIQQLLATGMSEDQIVADFVERYGPAILMAPPLQGFYSLAYVLPLLALLVGFWVLRRTMRASQQQAVDSDAPRAPDAPIPSEVQQALDRFRQEGRD